jgi:hypothetical protein
MAPTLQLLEHQLFGHPESFLTAPQPPQPADPSTPFRHHLHHHHHVYVISTFLHCVAVPPLITRMLCFFAAPLCRSAQTLSVLERFAHFAQHSMTRASAPTADEQLTIERFLATALSNLSAQERRQDVLRIAFRYLQVCFAITVDCSPPRSMKNLELMC